MKQLFKYFNEDSEIEQPIDLNAWNKIAET